VATIVAHQQSLKAGQLMRLDGEVRGRNRWKWGARRNQGL
jgi:hypothetical protein